MAELPITPHQSFKRFSEKILSWLDASKLYLWSTIWVLGGLFFGLIVLSCLTMSSDLNLGIVIIWAIAYFFLGGLIGCLFGVPKAVSNPPSLVTNNNINPSELSNEAQANTSSSVTKESTGKGSTNLTDISEWFTKIVLGAGLVELNNIPSFVLKVAREMGKGIKLNGVPNTTILCAGIIVYYTCFGLIAGYFLMRTVFLDLMEDKSNI